MRRYEFRPGATRSEDPGAVLLRAFERGDIDLRAFEDGVRDGYMPQTLLERARTIRPAPQRRSTEDDAARRGREKAEAFIRQVRQDVKATVGATQARKRRLEKLERELGEQRVARAELAPPGRWGSELRAVLLHEAGHVVAARTVGTRVRRVECEYVAGRPTGRGSTVFATKPRDARILLAGPVAERWADPEMGWLGFRQWLDERRALGDTDIATAERLCNRGYSGDPSWPRDFGRAWQATVELLRERWSEVEAVADAMASSPGGRLDSRQIDKALAEFAPRHGIQVIR